LRPVKLNREAIEACSTKPCGLRSRCLAYDPAGVGQCRHRAPHLTFTVPHEAPITGMGNSRR